MTGGEWRYKQKQKQNVLPKDRGANEKMRRRREIDEAEVERGTRKARVPGTEKEIKTPGRADPYAGMANVYVVSVYIYMHIPSR